MRRPLLSSSATSTAEITTTTLQSSSVRRGINNDSDKAYSLKTQSELTQWQATSDFVEVSSAVTPSTREESAKERLSNILVENARSRFPLFVVLLPVCAVSVVASPEDALLLKSPLLITDKERQEREREREREWVFESDWYRMYFVCSHTMQITSCGSPHLFHERQTVITTERDEEESEKEDWKDGFLLTRPKEWMREMAPYLQASLALARVGISFSKLPLPHPDLYRVKDIQQHIHFLDCAMERLQDMLRGCCPSSMIPHRGSRLQDMRPFCPLDAVQAWKSLSSSEHHVVQYSLAELLRVIDPSLTHTGLRRCVSIAGHIQWVWDCEDVEVSFVRSLAHSPSLAAMNAVIELCREQEIEREVFRDKQRNKNESCCERCCAVL